MEKNTKVPEIKPVTAIQCILSLKRYLKSNPNPVLYLVVSKLQTINFIYSYFIEKKKFETKKMFNLNFKPIITKPKISEYKLVIIYVNTDELDEAQVGTKAEVLATFDNKISTFDNKMLLIPATKNMLNENFY